jgi:hypothetical protein
VPATVPPIREPFLPQGEPRSQTEHKKKPAAPVGMSIEEYQAQ